MRISLLNCPNCEHGLLTYTSEGAVQTLGGVIADQQLRITCNQCHEVTTWYKPKALTKRKRVRRKSEKTEGMRLS